MTGHRITVVYKIVAAADWCAAAAAGGYGGSADDIRDGFIHLSTAAQLAGTAERHFRGHADLLLVGLDVGRLGAALKWEASRGGALFPHYYGRLDTGAVTSVEAMPLGANDVPIVPSTVTGEAH